MLGLVKCGERENVEQVENKLRMTLEKFCP